MIGSSSSSTMFKNARASSATTVQKTQTDLSPELHEIQLRYRLASTTMKSLTTIKEKPDRRTILEKACFATEFSGFRIRQAERAFFRHVNDHTSIPFMVRETVSQPHHKVFLFIQINLQREGWPNKLSGAARKELQQEKGKMYSILERVLKCLIDILGQRLDGAGVNVGLEVLRSIKSGVWEGSGGELLQIDGVGAVKWKKLSDAGIKTIKQLADLEFYHIERLLSRNPPFGQNMLYQLAGFPDLTLRLDIMSTADGQSSEEGSGGSQDEYAKWVVRLLLGYQNNKIPR